MTEKPAKARMGRPPKLIEKGAPARTTYSVRLVSSARTALLAASERSGRSLSEEIERRLEQSFERDQLRGLGGRVDVVISKVTARIRRVAMQMPDTMRGTPLEHEMNTRREWQAAMDVIAHVYAPTEAERPADPGLTFTVRAWGSGDHGRLYAYNLLEAEGDDLNAIDEAKSTAVEDMWTGDGSKVLGDLVEAGFLTRDQASKRLFPEGEPRPLEEIMAAETRPETPEERAAAWDAMLNRDSASDTPVEKPKRGRKAKA